MNYSISKLELTGEQAEYKLAYKIARFLSDYEKQGWKSYSVEKHRTYTFFQSKTRTGELQQVKSN